MFDDARDPGRGMSRRYSRRMDEIVKAALKKWPNVPHCVGWLALDARGDWYMRDERIQAAGPFPQVKGSRILHDKLREFIHRNYEHDEHGAWFFQNGPQRVYVELEAAPWVLRVRALGAEAGSADDAAGFELRTHTGREARALATFLDEQGRLYVETDLGLALVHAQDMHDASLALEQGAWPAPEELAAADVAQRFGFLASPQRAGLADRPRG